MSANPPDPTNDQAPSDFLRSLVDAMRRVVEATRDRTLAEMREAVETEAGQLDMSRAARETATAPARRGGDHRGRLLGARRDRADPRRRASQGPGPRWAARPGARRARRRQHRRARRPRRTGRCLRARGLRLHRRAARGSRIPPPSPPPRDGCRRHGPPMRPSRSPLRGPAAPAPVARSRASRKAAEPVPAPAQPRGCRSPRGCPRWSQPRSRGRGQRRRLWSSPRRRSRWRPSRRRPSRRRPSRSRPSRLLSNRSRRSLPRPMGRPAGNGVASATDTAASDVIPAEPVAPEPVADQATAIQVHGLGSFGAITSFKQSLEKVEGDPQRDPGPGPERRVHLHRHPRARLRPGRAIRAIEGERRGDRARQRHPQGQGRQGAPRPADAAAGRVIDSRRTALTVRSTPPPTARDGGPQAEARPGTRGRRSHASRPGPPDTAGHEGSIGPADVAERRWYPTTRSSFDERVLSLPAEEAGPMTTSDAKRPAAALRRGRGRARRSTSAGWRAAPSRPRPSRPPAPSAS